MVNDYRPHVDCDLDHLLRAKELWFAEVLSEALELKPGMRVLDLGCGRAFSSIFLARTYRVTVWAADISINPSENWKRIEQANVEDRVFPICAEAHALPFSQGYFDAIVSLDAYQYFGTDDMYLGYCARFLRPGGRFGIVVPGVLAELTDPPDFLRPYWTWDFCSFHSPQWWKAHWQKTGLVEVEIADSIEDGWLLWLEFEEARGGLGFDKTPMASSELPFPTRTDSEERRVEMLREDAGRTFGFTRVIARRL